MIWYVKINDFAGFSATLVTDFPTAGERRNDF